MDPSKLEGMKRTELQQLAKIHGVKANMKSDKLREALRQILSDIQDGINVPKKLSAESACINIKPNAKIGSPAKYLTPVRKQMTPKCTPRNVTPKPSTPGLFSPKCSSLTKKLTGRDMRKDVLVKTPMSTKKSSQRKPISTPSTIGKVEKRKRSSLKTEEPNTSGQNKRQRRGTFDKDEPSPHVKDLPEVATRSSRRSTFEKSPGVSDMLQCMKSDMNDEEMKNSLMEALNKRVQDTVMPKPSTSSTSIPRYQGLTQTAPMKKPMTPGNKDWDKIHAKNFNKMQSIDEYLRQKKTRLEGHSAKMSASLKKVRQMRDQMRSNVESLKRYKTPPSVKKSSERVNKTAKPLFNSPNITNKNTKPFVPTVTSTSKANFNFTAMDKSQQVPSHVENKPFKPTVTSTSKANFNFKATTPKTNSSFIAGPRKSPRLSGTKENTLKRKSVGLDKSVQLAGTKSTPFKFTGKHNASNTSINTSLSTGPKFDLKASLAKALSWKPHTGKLKPLEVGNVKEVKTKTKEDRRKMHGKFRANNKMDSQMKRRGIS